MQMRKEKRGAQGGRLLSSKQLTSSQCRILNLSINEVRGALVLQITAFSYIFFFEYATKYTAVLILTSCIGFRYRIDRKSFIMKIIKSLDIYMDRILY